MAVRFFTLSTRFITVTSDCFQLDFLRCEKKVFCAISRTGFFVKRVIK